MKQAFKYFRSNSDVILLGGLLLFALINPVFKKYDYGPGFPLVILGALSGLILYLTRYKKPREKALFEFYFLGIFAIFIIISFVFSKTLNYGLSELVAFLSIIPIYLLLGLSEFKNKEKILKVIATGALIACFIGYLQFFWSSHPRMFGPFFNIFYHANVWPNAFALFLLLAWPISLFYFKKNYLIISFIISCLLLTYSRGALIAFCGQIVLLFIFYLGSLNIKNLYKVFLCGFFAFVLFFAAAEVRSDSAEVIDVSDRIEFENSEGLTSAKERIDFWVGAIEIIKVNPILGTGPYSFRYAYNPIQKTLLGAADHPHNIFLKIGSENGLIAMFSFLGFLMIWTINGFKRFKTLEKHKKERVFVIFVSIAGAMAHNLIDYNFNFYVNLLLFALLLAVSRSYLVKNPKKPHYNITIFIITIFISLISVYEIALGITGLRQYSLFLRDDLLIEADNNLNEGNYTKSLSYINKQLELNPLDSRAKYLKGVILCEENYKNSDPELCEDYLLSAINNNPKNNIGYYTDAFRHLEEEDKEFEIIKHESIELLKTYFDYVQMNVHFTAYTHNVESASQLIDLLIPHVDAQTAIFLKQNKQLMLNKAYELRKSKSY